MSSRIRFYIVWLRAGALAVLAIFLSAPLQGEPMIRELADTELQQLRGRYVPSENLQVFFGIKMQSQWQSADGSQYRGGMVFGFGQGQPVPTTQFYAYQSEDAAPMSESTRQGSQQTMGGLANVAGVVQANQLAGDGNSSRNMASVRVTDQASARQEFQRGSHQAGGESSQAIRVHRGDGALGLEIQTPYGSARQGIFGSQLSQSVTVTGNNQRVMQSLEIIMVTERYSFNANQAVHDAIRNTLHNP